MICDCGAISSSAVRRRAMTLLEVTGAPPWYSLFKIKRSPPYDSVSRQSQHLAPKPGYCSRSRGGHTSRVEIDQTQDPVLVIRNECHCPFVYEEIGSSERYRLEVLGNDCEFIWLILGPVSVRTPVIAGSNNDTRADL